MTYSYATYEHPHKVSPYLKNTCLMSERSRESLGIGGQWETEPRPVNNVSRDEEETERPKNSKEGVLDGENKYLKKAISKSRGNSKVDNQVMF